MGIQDLGTEAQALDDAVELALGELERAERISVFHVPNLRELEKARDQKAQVTLAPRGTQAVPEVANGHARVGENFANEKPSSRSGDALHGENELLHLFDASVILDDVVAEDERELLRLQERQVRVVCTELVVDDVRGCLLYTSPSPRDRTRSRMPSSA